jgi:RHS repeat-associated protein
VRPATAHITNSLTAFSAYRFHFNGQEADNEVAGSGNSYTAEFWQYDSRLGRRWNVDPMTEEFPWQSPYCTFDNNPICLTDPLGLSAEGEPKKETYTIQKGNTLSQIAKDNSTTVDELLSLNPNIKDKNKIFEGQVINLPTKPEAPTQNINKIQSQKEYKAGDKIPIRNGVVEIIEFNETSDGINITLGFQDNSTSGSDNWEGYNWIQTIKTNKPINGNKSPYLDGNPYYNDRYSSMFPGSWTTTFSDKPSRAANNNEYVLWRAELSLVNRTSSHTKTMLTITYGFYITPLQDGGKVRKLPIKVTTPTLFHSKSIPNK